MFLRRIAFAWFLLAAVVSAVFAAEKPSFVLSLSGGVNHFFPFGSAGDYQAGTNDFPVTPAHNPPLAGLAFGRTAGRWTFEFETRWTGESRAVLNDPSDGDSIEIKTTSHAAAALNVVFRIGSGRVRPFLCAGGGVDFVLARAASYTTNHGFTIEIPAPEMKDRFDPEVHGGGGFEIAVSAVLGFRGEVRYVWILDQSGAVQSLQASGGLTMRF